MLVEETLVPPTLEDSLEKLSALHSPIQNVEGTLEKLFDSFGDVIPYDRIGIGLISEDRERLELKWMKSKTPSRSLKTGFFAPIKGTSLEKIIISESPRIISNLAEYYERHPDSESSRRALEDGIRSSLACPLSSARGTLGIIFFSSFEINTYSHRHLQIFCLIAHSVASAIDRELGQAQRSKLLRRENFYRKALHDLRQPLSVLRFGLDHLLHKSCASLEPQIAKELSTLHKQGTLMENLLNDIQNALELGEADFSVQRRRIELSPFLEGLSVAAECLTRANNIGFKMKASDTLPHHAFLDSQRITQVIGNLLTNAIKFSSPHTEIVLSVDSTSEGLKFSVRDQGAGIPRLEIPKIFSPKQRTLKTCPSNFERSQGLGLSIVKRIVEQHGGTVGVESQLGLGSNFYFILPQTA